MTWEEATQLSDAITESSDSGAWHARVAVAAGDQGYAVIVRQHNTHELHYLRSMEEFIALCEQLKTQRM